MPDPLAYPTREAAEAAMLEHAPHLLALLADGSWVQADEADERPTEVVGWGICDSSGERMLDPTDNTWVVVA